MKPLLTRAASPFARYPKATMTTITQQHRSEAFTELVSGAPYFEQRYKAYAEARAKGLTHQQSITYGFLMEDTEKAVTQKTAYEYSRAWCPVLMLLDDCTGILMLEDF